MWAILQKDEVFIVHLYFSGTSVSCSKETHNNCDRNQTSQGQLSAPGIQRNMGQPHGHQGSYKNQGVPHQGGTTNKN